MHQFLPFAWFGGKCVPFAEATLSVATHALHYGTGAFGGMRALPNPQDPAEMLLFRPDRHVRRLSQSARLLLTELSEDNDPRRPSWRFCGPTSPRHRSIYGHLSIPVILVSRHVCIISRQTF